MLGVGLARDKLGKKLRDCPKPILDKLALRDLGDEDDAIFRRRWHDHVSAICSGDFDRAAKNRLDFGIAPAGDRRVGSEGGRTGVGIAWRDCERDSLGFGSAINDAPVIGLVSQAGHGRAVILGSFPWFYAGFARTRGRVPPSSPFHVLFSNQRSR